LADIIDGALYKDAKKRKGKERKKDGDGATEHSACCATGRCAAIVQARRKRGGEKQEKAAALIGIIREQSHCNDCVVYFDLVRKGGEGREKKRGKEKTPSLQWDCSRMMRIAQMVLVKRLVDRLQGGGEKKKVDRIMPNDSFCKKKKRGRRRGRINRRLR